MAFQYQMIGFDILPLGLKTHLGKYEGLSARLMLTFHLIECAAANESHHRYISEATAERVLYFMKEFLFWHSYSFYADTLSSSGLTDAVRWVGGYILAKSSATLSNRELIQNFGWWRNAKDWEKGQVYGRLREFGWLKTKEIKDRFQPVPSVMEVNPEVHSKFAAIGSLEKIKREASAEALADRFSKVLK